MFYYSYFLGKNPLDATEPRNHPTTQIRTVNSNTFFDTARKKMNI